MFRLEAIKRTNVHLLSTPNPAVHCAVHAAKSMLQACARMAAHLLGGFLHLLLQLLELSLTAAAAVHVREPGLQFLHVVSVLAAGHRIVHPFLQL